jgi:hypothetical protein
MAAELCDFAGAEDAANVVAQLQEQPAGSIKDDSSREFSSFRWDHGF